MPRATPPAARAPRIGMLRVALAVATAVVALCVMAGTASASHEKGGSLTASIADGRLSGTLSYITSGTCTVGNAASVSNVTVTNPSAASATATPVAVYTRCAGGRTATGTYDLDLAAAFGSAADGVYQVEFNSCCRVSGIVNTTGSSTILRARVTKSGDVPSSSPAFNSDVALGIAIGHEYRQNLNSTDPDGGALTFESRAGQSDGPDYDVITLSGSGTVTIAASQTSTYTAGQAYVYKVRSVDAGGDFSERDVLLTAGNNTPPVLTGLSGDTYDVAAGATREIDFSASDADADQTLVVDVPGLPAWAALQRTGTNPVTAKLVLSPPAEAPGQTFSLNVDAIDSHSTVAMTASETITIRVLPAPTTSLTSMPSALARSRAATFAFSSGDSTATFECRVDDAPSWTACTTPVTLSSLADGEHTFRARAVNTDGTADPTPATWTWRVDTVAPAAPGVTGTPGAVTQERSATLTLVTEDGAALECSVDGAAFAACTSPLVRNDLPDGTYSVAVRSRDAAGNLSGATTVAWVVDTVAPDPVAFTTGPADVAGAARFTWPAQDGLTYECRIGDGEAQACTSPFDPVLADGRHNVTVVALDAAGNRSEGVSRTFELDTVAPARPAILSGPVGTTVARDARFELAGEPGATFECSLDGAPAVPCASPVAYTRLALGAHTLAVRQIDLAGNRSEAIVTSWTVAATEAPVQQPRTARALVSATIAVKAGGRRATVGCEVDRGQLRRCKVDAYVEAAAGQRRRGKAAATARLRKVGTGLYVARRAERRASVDVVLNALGRRLVQRAGGVRVRFDVTATPVAGKVLEARAYGRLLPQHTVAVPQNGLFALGSAALSPTGQRYLRALDLRRVRRLTCVGHTDASGAAAFNRALGLRRAATVCRFLASRTRAATTVRTAGESRPRATNRTSTGRSLNRRVEVVLRYRTG